MVYVLDLLLQMCPEIHLASRIIGRTSLSKVSTCKANWPSRHEDLSERSIYHNYIMILFNYKFYKTYEIWAIATTKSLLLCVRRGKAGLAFPARYVVLFQFPSLKKILKIFEYKNIEGNGP